MLVVAGVVTGICTAAGWVLGSPFLGTGVGLGLCLCGVVQGRDSPGADERSASRDIDYFRIPRARIDGDVETLIAALDDEINASLAADSLGKIGAVSAIPALVQLLERTDPQQRASAVLALAMLDASTACPKIMEMAEQDTVPWVRAWATQALGDLPCDGGQLLIRALDDADIRVRRTAVTVLMNAGQPDAIPALRAARKRERLFSRRIYSKAIRRLKRRSRRLKA